MQEENRFRRSTLHERVETVLPTQATDGLTLDLWVGSGAEHRRAQLPAPILPCQDARTQGGCAHVLVDEFACAIGDCRDLQPCGHLSGAGGSTEGTRKAAARQIAEIAKLHPEQLPSLLRKVNGSVPKTRVGERELSSRALKTSSVSMSGLDGAVA
eukprot:366113-Chlamydomonas_euryale.AAC.8